VFARVKYPDKTVWATLLAETGFNGNAFAAFGATARQNGGSALRFHTGTETVHLGTATTVGLERALGHET
jgi:hypothetical protein